MCFKLVFWTVYVLQSSNPEYITVGMKYLGLLFQKGLYILQNLDFAIGQNISHLAAGNTSFFILTAMSSVRIMITNSTSLLHTD